MTLSKKIRSLSLAVLAGLASACLAADPVVAGPGVGHSHSHEPASKDQILETAKKVRENLIKEDKIQASWQTVEPSGAEQKAFKNGKTEWVVTFKDPLAADKTKETLFMFFSLGGNYLASNFTGK